ncbi:hypothetical protein [Aurantiacibacter aquimixticola]|uniref:Uncharacterized protein n=1 Tax=Aurantiacibacter aquimixticola TaxID=1958945 RepID=A0A419RU77_9SPHN|nr:hypothetical protein [Aurantiacibacter aquimixticola]RJY09341.1 hypothetical protein D6201_08215 [Aurantiacibacter aquimixticola]
MLTLFATLSMLAAPQEGGPFLTFSRRAAEEPDTLRVQVGELRTDDARPHFWMRKAVEGQGATAIEWTDTVRCPKARNAIVAATQIAPPRVYVPGIPVRPDGSYVITMDGVQYELTASAHYDSRISSDIRFTSNVGSPLANWVEGTLESLEDCWSADLPDGERL